MNFSHLVTGTETWISYTNVKDVKANNHAMEPFFIPKSQSRRKKIFTIRKIMATVFRDTKEGVCTVS